MSNVSSGAHLWASAVAYCADLVENGFSDWRLPSYAELRSITSALPSAVWTADIHWNSYVNCNRVAYTFGPDGSLPTQHYGAGNCRETEYFRVVCVR